MEGGFAAGYVTRHGQLVPGSQPPVISPDVWAEFLGRREAARYTPRQSSDDFLIAGMVWCVCGQTMSAVHLGGSRYARYQCRYHPKGRPGQSIVRDRVDEMVRSWVSAVVADPAVRRSIEDDVRGRIAQLAAHAEELRGQLPECRPDGEERASLIAQLDGVRAAALAPPPRAVAAALLEDWAVLDHVGRRGRLQGLVQRVTVENVRPTTLLHLTTTWGTVVSWNGVHDAQQGEAEAATEESAPVEMLGDGSPDPLQLVTPAEAARITGVAVNTVRSWYNAGLLPQHNSTPMAGTAATPSRTCAAYEIATRPRGV